MKISCGLFGIVPQEVFIIYQFGKFETVSMRIAALGKNQIYKFIASTIAAGFTVISTHAGIKPLLTAFLTERIFDHAVQ